MGADPDATSDFDYSLSWARFPDNDKGFFRRPAAVCARRDRLRAAGWRKGPVELNRVIRKSPSRYGAFIADGRSRTSSNRVGQSNRRAWKNAVALPLKRTGAGRGEKTRSQGAPYPFEPTAVVVDRKGRDASDAFHDVSRRNEVGTTISMMRIGAPHAGQRTAAESQPAPSVPRRCASGLLMSGAGGSCPSSSRQRASFSRRRQLAVMP